MILNCKYLKVRKASGGILSEDCTITEYHLCSECINMIEVPSKKEYKFEVGCLHPLGKPNPTGGLTDCKYYRGE